MLSKFQKFSTFSDCYRLYPASKNSRSFPGPVYILNKKCVAVKNLTMKESDNFFTEKVELENIGS